jgi:LysM repeat protein
MSRARHVVQSGETLWGISEKTLGDGARWPRIWRYNNRRDVVRVTGRGIPDPDLIYPGQLLLIPVIPHHPVRSKHPHPSPPPSSAVAATSSGSSAAPAPSAGRGNGPLARQLPKIASPISIKYRLDDLKFPPIVQPGVVMEIRMTGDIVLMTQKAYPAVYVTQRREIELQVTSQANKAFNALVSDTRLIYDSRDGRLTYRSMLVTSSTTPNAPTTAVGVQFDSNSPVPKLRFEFRLPKLQGSIPPFNYNAIDVKLVVEMTLTPQGGGPTNTAQPLRAPAPQPVSNWAKVLGTGLLVVGGAIVVGTLVEDFFTVGAGADDDAPSFAAAGATVARGMQLLRGAAVVLPAAAPAAITISVSVSPSGR